MLALIFSAAALGFFLLRNWRDEMAQQIADASRQRRRAEKDQLRSALAGDDQPPPKRHLDYQLVEPATFGQGFHHGLIR